jgi:hypothetical protein
MHYNILRHNTLYKKIMDVIIWTELTFYPAKKIVSAHVKDAQKQIAHQNISKTLNLKLFIARSVEGYPFIRS